MCRSKDHKFYYISTDKRTGTQRLLAIGCRGGVQLDACSSDQLATWKKLRASLAELAAEAKPGLKKDAAESLLEQTAAMM